MFVVQLFVMKDGAFQGVEMAAGSRIVVGPPTADVPLEGVTQDGVVLTLRGDTLVASTLGDARVNGVAVVEREVTASQDVCVGDYVIKVRRMNAQPQAQAQAQAQTFAESVTKPSMPVQNAHAADARVHMQVVTVPEVHLPVTELLEMTETLPEPVFTFDGLGDDVDGEDAVDDEADEVDWSLVEALARPPEGSGDLVEVIHAHGEHVVTHALLKHASDAFDLGDRALVTRTHDGCRIELPAKSMARTRRNGALGDIMAGDKPLSVSLAKGDAATLSIGGAVFLVRFVKRVELALSADDLKAQRLERKVQALCASAGISLCSLWGAALWIAAYRAREMTLSLPDEFHQWPEVELVMEKPKPIEPTPVPEPTPEPEPQKSSASAAPKQPARGGSTKAPAASALDTVRALPAIPTPSTSWETAMKNMRAPIPGRPGGPVLTGLMGRGPRGESQVGGSGLNTGVSSKRLDGTGSLEKRDDRAIGGGVDRVKLNKLRTPPESGLSKEAILRVINEHIGEIQYCYEKGLRGDASLGGRVVVEWTIGANGRVTNARNETSTLAGNAVEDCMLKQIKTWQFPTAKNPSQVVYPFSFSSI